MTAARERFEAMVDRAMGAALVLEQPGYARNARDQLLLAISVLQKDAERYRWLRNATRMVDGSVEGMLTIHAIHDDAAPSEIRDDLDAAIAALSREGAGHV